MSIFHFHLHFRHDYSYNLMNADIHVNFAYEYVLLFLDDNVDEECE